MVGAREHTLGSTIYDRPIQTAIRWRGGRMRRERQVLAVLSIQIEDVSEPEDSPRSSTLRRNTERTLPRLREQLRWESVSDSVELALHLMAMHLYDAACRKNEPPLVERPHKALSLRERQCLELVAQGKSDWAIGQILRISEHTVHRYIESAKHRLGVATRVQAIMCALQGRQISMGDVIRADKPIEIVRN